MASDAIHKRAAASSSSARSAEVAGGVLVGGDRVVGSNGSSYSPSPAAPERAAPRRRRGRRGTAGVGSGGGGGGTTAAARAVRIAAASLVLVWLITALLVVENSSPVGDGSADETAPAGGGRAGRLGNFSDRLRRLRLSPKEAGKRLRGVERKIEAAAGGLHGAGDGFHRAERVVEHRLHEAELKVKEMAERAMRRVGDVVVEAEDMGERALEGAVERVDGMLPITNAEVQEDRLGRVAGGGAAAGDAGGEAAAEKAAKAPKREGGGRDHKGWARELGSDPKATVVDHPIWGPNTDELIDMRRLDATLPFDDPDGGAWKQGWDVEPRPLDPSKPLKVFVVPHSHCDPGWIKTFDRYFQDQTKKILTTVYEALLKDERRRFIWAEISYFEWWWREQSQSVQTKMRDLIDGGRFEFVTGGWVQPDEANTERYAIEVQLREGHDWIRGTFGEGAIPEYGWSIDPFGYSPTMADVLREYGFKGMLIQRVHYAVKKELAKRRHLEFMWRQTWDKNGTRDIFAHVMPFYSYDVPHTCGPDPSVCCQFDFARLNHGFGGCPWRKPPEVITDKNVKKRAEMLLDQYRKKASLYRGDAVIAPLGDDFRYEDAGQAEAQYANYQRMFDHINRNVPGVEIRFGTLSDYFRAVEGTFHPPVLRGSFFTYADRQQDYWSGYFTSRVFDKALDRRLERALYAAESRGATAEEMRGPRRALSLFQHHDGVTGTAKDHVVVDYARRMRDAVESAQEWLSKSVNAELGRMEGAAHPSSEVGACWRSDAPRDLGSNVCDPSLPAYAYNPLPTEQRCGDATVPPKSVARVTLPCEMAGPASHSSSSGEDVRFDPVTGMMTHPVREEWMVWEVTEGGAYLFFPGKQVKFDLSDVKVERGGYMVSTPRWRRKVIERRLPEGYDSASSASAATVLDFVFETKLTDDNREWFVRFTSPGLTNGGIFHTDLNGYDFDTHRLRTDLPIQSQVFPMPTLASVQDESRRLTVLSEHAQGTASLSDGTIDVWLDRRLSQDDRRGLFQGVKDNVHTRTRLRVMVEGGGYDPDPESEFNVTELGRRMWDELEHPLELFGAHADAVGGGAPPPADARGGAAETAEKRRLSDGAPHHEESKARRIVPFVYMVHKRVDYLRRAIDSLRSSDFPRSRVPLIISHDGHVPEMVSYVESLKGEFELVQLFHPYACYDHPDSFPGNDEKLNEGYKGDSYGHKRSPWATCAKHHWAWMMRTVWDMDFGADGMEVDEMMFMEEDYVVSPNIYDIVTTGLDLARDPTYFGIALDITNGGIDREVTYAEGWVERQFRTGPMAIPRRSWEAICDAREVFCKFDEYNWDWSVMKVQYGGLVTDRVLAPPIQQVHHIGVEGMHIDSKARGKARRKVLNAARGGGTVRPFYGKRIVSGDAMPPYNKPKGNGGWGHPRDHEHCLEVLGGAKAGGGNGGGFLKKFFHSFGG